MKIINLKGTDERLYGLVARLIMNPAVLRQNNNYPFRTSLRHTWYIAMDGDAVIGFLPVKDMRPGLYLDNYYIKGDNAQTLSCLLKYLISDSDQNITAMVHTRHADIFRQHGFISYKKWTKYEKMQYHNIICKEK
ncbi:hypothetical protein [Xylanibacter muris]|uniref:N-acetyltransferase domain-containing protein n=1 Tax=Xylanibacter muris TaxID=2736290 RepID=A0ABX2APV3_9BACT|nr:hypothetical protein [Xylanibacter muris]NPD92234.1 hypothetical protein [Xylanibacter muris]